MNSVLVVGADAQRAHLIDKGLEDAAVRVVREPWETFLHTQRAIKSSLVIYDLAGEDTPQADILVHLPAKTPDIWVLYLGGSDKRDLESLSQALLQPNVDFILEAEDTREFRLRAKRLLARRPEPIHHSIVPGIEGLRSAVPELHTSNGRLDARAVSALYGVSLAALARAVGRSEQSVHKTPAALSLQPSLQIYERIAAMLLRLTGSEIGLRAWMNASNPELDDEAPLTLLLGGEGEIVAELLEDVLSGAPA
jgi:hypothetical protein